MIGGIVIETEILADKVWVNCAEKNGKSTCAVYVERNADSEKIRLGDLLWWQAGYCYWTPVSKKVIERKIRKIGYSGVSRPSREATPA